MIFQSPEAYILCAFVQALLHASTACNHKLVVDLVPAEHLEDDTSKEVIDLSIVLHVIQLICFTLCLISDDKFTSCRILMHIKLLGVF